MRRTPVQRFRCSDAAPTRRCSAYAERADHPFPLFGLAPSVVYQTLWLPRKRWALTPPFHPYLACARRYIFCDTFRQPRLASKLPPAFPGRIALWCPDFPPQNLRRGVAATALVPFKSIKPKTQLTIPRLEHQNHSQSLNYPTPSPNSNQPYSIQINGFQVHRTINSKTKAINHL